MNPSRREIMRAANRLRHNRMPGDRVSAVGPNDEPVSVVLSEEHAKELRELKHSPDIDMSDELAAAIRSAEMDAITEVRDDS